MKRRVERPPNWPTPKASAVPCCLSLHEVTAERSGSGAAAEVTSTGRCRSGASVDEEHASGKLGGEAASIHPMSGTPTCHDLHRYPWLGGSGRDRATARSFFCPWEKTRTALFSLPLLFHNVPLMGQTRGTRQCCET